MDFFKMGKQYGYKCVDGGAGIFSGGQLTLQCSSSAHE